jgi:hypothetical protein
LPLVSAFFGFALLWSIAGCGVFSPSFVSLIDPSGTSSLTTVENAPGHVVVTVVNNAEVDERLLSFLESAPGGSLVLTDVEKRALRPRIRFRVRITYVDGQEAIVEFVNGSRRLVQSTFNTSSEPDLNQNDLNNVVATCDVASVQVVNPVEVFIPVELRQFGFVEPTGLMPGFFREIGRTLPEFRGLQVDQVDADLNTVARFNIDIRDQPAPANNPRCGSVVAIVVDGVLTVPFREDQMGVPGFDVTDLDAAGSIGGRYEFRLSVQ